MLVWHLSVNRETVAFRNAGLMTKQTAVAVVQHFIVFWNSSGMRNKEETQA